MQPQSSQDYKQLLTDVIKKQIVILGPDITLSKARNVKGLTVADDGTVTNVDGQPQAVTQALIDQFVQLSGLIVKKTMEPLLSMTETPTPPTPPTPTIVAAPMPTTEPLTAQPTVTQPAAPAMSTVEPTAPIQPATSPTAAEPVTPVPTQPTPISQSTAPSNLQQTGDPSPSKNPLAA